MIPGAKGLSPHELAHKWVKDLLTPTKEQTGDGTSKPELAFDSDGTIQNHEIMKLLYRWIKKTGATGGMQGEYR